ncbi:MAG TPA: DUF6573 family protein [Pirellulales bacterium]|jgi:hypothetical protein
MSEENDLRRDGWDLIHVYTRAEAIEDGVLIDVSETAREAGFRFPVAMTDAAWHKLIAVPPELGHQDEIGRLWDVLNVLLFSIRKSKDNSSEIRFRVSVLNEHEKLEEVEVKSLCGPGDNLEPVITIMLPDED